MKQVLGENDTNIKHIVQENDTELKTKLRALEAIVTDQSRRLSQLEAVGPTAGQSQPQSVGTSSVGTPELQTFGGT